MTMRRFEYVEGTSNKFWCIELQGASFVVTFGRMGTAGQTQTKSFDSPDLAHAEHDKLILEKVKKGYAEVGAGASPPPTPAAPPRAPKAPKAVTPKQDAPPVEPVEVPVEPPAVPPAPPAVDSGRAPPSAEGEDGVLWTDALEKAVLPKRGSTHCRTPAALKPIKKSWAHVREVLAARHGKIPEDQPALRKEAALLLAQQEFASAGPEKDALLLGILEWRPTWDAESATPEFVDLLTAAVDVAHATRVMLTVWAAGQPPGQLKNQHGGISPSGLVRLRELLFLANEEAFQAAQHTAAQLRTTSVQSRSATSFLFPDAPWVQEDVDALVQGQGHLVVLAAVRREQDFAALAPAHSRNLFGRWGNVDLDGYALAALLVEHAGLGAASYIAAAVGQYTGSDELKQRAAILACLGCDTAVEALVAGLETREAQAGLMDAGRRQPRRVIRLLAPRAGQRGKIADLASTILTAVLRQFPGLASEVFPSLNADGQRVLSTIAASSSDQVPDAKPEDVPSFLAKAPWLDRPRARDVAVTVQGPKLPDAINWNPGEKEQWAAVSYWHHATRDRTAWTEQDWSKHIAVASRITLPEIVTCPTPLLDAILTRLTDFGYDSTSTLMRALERHGLALLPFLVARSELGAVVPVVAPLASTRLAPRMAEAFATRKSVRADARAWLLRHPEHATAGLLPAALGVAGTSKVRAQHALRMMGAAGKRDVILATAHAASAEAAAAVTEILDVDPLTQVPAKLPALPAWLEPGTLPRPTLRQDKGALPTQSVSLLLMMLAISTTDEPYSGVALAKDALAPTSLARMGWAIFQAWLLNGATSKDAWCLQQLAFTGDDECARKLAALIREWPGQAAHARAVSGLDVLAGMGSDVALMHLNGIAEKLKFKGLQAKAREKIEELAEARGLTREELADRLAPDLGLDDDGGLLLDFGARQFRVGFDEQLRPFVKDAEGTRLKDLPKAGKTDDADKGKAAQERWSALKKDARTAAGIQLLRMELAMCLRRRFQADVFTTFFVRHPLVFHIARRLVWAVYDKDAKILGTFRVAEDRTLANVDEDVVTLPADAVVGIPHAMELDLELTGRWGQVLADYELLQPFPQLGRPVHKPTPAELEATALARVDGVKVPTGKVLGLESKGWRRGSPQDGGVSCWYEKPLPDNLTAQLDLDPGIIAGMPGEYPEQTLGSVTIHMGGTSSWGSSSGGVKVGRLDAISFSELVRDLEALRG